jgi:hypothetical protein
VTPPVRVLQRDYKPPAGKRLAVALLGLLGLVVVAITVDYLVDRFWWHRIWGSFLYAIFRTLWEDGWLSLLRLVALIVGLGLAWRGLRCMAGVCRLRIDQSGILVGTLPPIRWNMHEITWGVGEGDFLGQQLVLTVDVSWAQNHFSAIRVPVWRRWWGRQ